MRRGDSTGSILLVMFFVIFLPIMLFVTICQAFARMGKSLNDAHKSSNSKKLSKNNAKKKGGYDKILPHITTDDDSDDDDKYIDDLIGMDMLDDD